MFLTKITFMMMVVFLWTCTDGLNWPPRRTPDCPRCNSPSLCLTREEVMQYLNRSPASCTSCVLAECHSDIKSLRAFRNCIISVSEECKCPPASEDKMATIQPCNDCLKKCDENRESCRSFCSSSRYPCPTADEIISTIAREPQNCRKCISKRCESENKDAQCMYEARVVCSECVVSSRAHYQRRQCKDCVERCAARRDLPTATAKPPTTKRPANTLTSPSNGHSRLSPCSCFADRTCPSSAETRMMMKYENEDCRLCVSQFCGNVRRGVGSNFVRCVAYGTQRCSMCTSRLRSCRACFDGRCSNTATVTPFSRPQRPLPPKPHSPNPSTTKPPTPKPTTTEPSTPKPTTTEPPTPKPTTTEPPTPKPTTTEPPTPKPTTTKPPTPKPSTTKPPTTKSSTNKPRQQTRETMCRKVCSRRYQCPSEAQIDATIRYGVPQNCRTCIMNVCGRGLNSRGADCMFQARATCDECSLSDREREQRDDCRQCLVDCASRTGESGESIHQ